jgi:hypothetical protein
MPICIVGISTLKSEDGGLPRVADPFSRPDRTHLARHVWKTGGGAQWLNGMLKRNAVEANALHTDGHTLSRNFNFRKLQCAVCQRPLCRRAASGLGPRRFRAPHATATYLRQQVIDTVGCDQIVRRNYPELVDENHHAGLCRLLNQLVGHLDADTTAIALLVLRCPAALR